MENKGNLRNNFGGRGWFLVIFFGVMLFLNSSYTADGMNIIIPTLAGKNGWDPNLMLSMNGIGGYCAVVGAFVLSACVRKFGAKAVTLFSLVMTIIGLALMAFGTGFGCWIAAVIIINIFANGFSFCAGSALVASWFPTKKGLVMGWSTIGNNMASAIFIPIFSALLALGVFAPFIVNMVFCAIMFVLCIFFIRNNPEDFGKAPDNEPASVEELERNKKIMAAYQSPWTVGKLLKDREVWLCSLGYGLLFMATVGMICQFTVYIPSLPLGFATENAVTMLSIAAIVAIPASYLWGVIDQKWGTKVASMLLAIWFAVAILLLIIPTKGTIWAGTIMFGCAIGGNTNFTTSMCASLFGRFDFQRAFNIIFPITCIFRATAAVIMGALLGASGGNFKVPYIVFIAGSVIAFILFAFVRYKPKEMGPIPEVS